MSEILKFDQVTAGYGERDVIKNFSCSIQSGEFVSLIGPNGSGKSTLVHTITGMLTPKSGKIFLDGRESKSFSQKKRAQITAVVPQNFIPGFAFKAKEIVAMGRHPYLKRMQSESEEDYRIIDEAMEQTGTLHLRERRITQLSGGERQRIIISAALAQRPKLLILDEPTNHLDIQYTLEILELMRKLNREQGITILSVLHDINMAARFSDRIVVLDRGEKIADGPAGEIICEDILKPVYRIDLVVRDNVLTSSPEIVPLRSSKDTTRRLNGKTVHIICGGGSGSRIIENFYNHGWQVSCGVLSSGDSDYDLARSLGLTVIEEMPYSPISDKVSRNNLQMASTADLVVLADVDIGMNNLKNISILSALSKTPICILREKAGDYTGGRGETIITNLIADDHARRVTAEELTELITRADTSAQN